MPSSDVPPHRWDADGTPLQEVYDPNATLGESSDSSPRRSHPLHQREDLLVPPGRVKARTIADPAHDRGPPDSYLLSVESREVGGGCPTAPTAPKKQGKVFDAPRSDGFVYDRSRRCPDDEGAPSRPGRTEPAYQSTGASTALPEAGGRSSTDAVPLSRGIFWDTNSTRSLAILPEGRQVTPPTMQAWATFRGRGKEDQVANGPGPCLNVEEARASTSHLAATPTSHRLGVASQGVGRVNQIKLVDRSTYKEGVCRKGCPPRDLAAFGQGHASESPGGLIHPSGAVPLQFPPCPLTRLLCPFLSNLLYTLFSCL